jgi:hypothetical protein
MSSSANQTPGPEPAPQVSGLPSTIKAFETCHLVMTPSFSRRTPKSSSKNAQEHSRWLGYTPGRKVWQIAAFLLS